MNKRVFYLVIFLLVIVSVFSAKIYLNTKKNVLQENNYVVLLENKLRKVSALKQKYKFNKTLFSRLKSICETTNKDEKYVIVCKNLDSGKFNTVQNILFKNNFKILNFKITKNKLAELEAEINK